MAINTPSQITGYVTTWAQSAQQAFIQLRHRIASLSQAIFPVLTHPETHRPCLERIVAHHFICDCQSKNYPLLPHPFLFPNEPNPKNLLPHLANISPGFVVSTGTERSLALLLLCNEEKCQGLTVIDIDPSVKAYIDFTVLLLRITHSRNDFLSFSQNPENSFQLDERLYAINDRIKTSAIPEPMKTYYSHHLETLAKAYFSVDRWWNSKYMQTNPDFFAGARYDQEDALFFKLQRYAKAGQIISIVGTINQLDVLKNQPISIVDTSNIWEYSLVYLTGYGPTPPKVIWTTNVFMPEFPVSYSSCTLDPILLTPETQRKLILSHETQETYLDRIKHTYLADIPTPDIVQRYFQHLYPVPGTELVLDMMNDMQKIEQFSEETIQRMIADPNIKRFLPQLVLAFNKLPNHYFNFMTTEGWREAFIEQINEDPDQLGALYDWLSQQNGRFMEFDYWLRTPLDSLAQKQHWPIPALQEAAAKN